LIYWDSSAFVKKYLREEGSAAVVHRLTDDPAVATSILSYAEIRAVFARKASEEGAGPGSLTHSGGVGTADWTSRRSLGRVSFS